MALFSVADIVTALFMLVAVVDAILRKDERKSSKALLAAMIASAVMVVLDALSGFVYPASTPDAFLYMAAAVSILATKIIMQFHCFYCCQYFRERVNISRWVYITPMALLVLSVIAQACAVCSGGYITVSGGTAAITGSAPAMINLVSIVLAFYFPVLVIMKRKEVGIKALFFVGAFNFVLIVLSVVGLHDYTTCYSALIIFMTYAFLQNGIQNQREREREILEREKAELEALNARLKEHQTQLEESASRQEAQIAEISALNSQLQDNQAELEASASEQEAQLEEIAALNTQLEENQARLEEVSAEQEVQLEETRALNQELEESRNRISESFGMIEGLSKEYHTIWLVSKETSKMRLIRSSGKSTIRRAVQMGIDEPLFDPAFDTYIGSCVEPEDRERMHREIAFAEVLRHLSEHPGEMYAVNYLRRDDSGHVGYHQIAFANADTEDGKKQFVYGFRDVDKIVKEEQRQKEELRKAKEDAESANAAKTSFLFNMSHDIRTPMNAIMGFRDLLEKHQEDPEKRQDYLNKIQDASTVLLSIINNVLEMARIEKGTLEIDETAWSTEQFNDTLYSVFHVMMAEKGLTFTRQIDVQNHYVYCDPTKLREIFINILSNAYKYTNAGGSVNMRLEEIPSDRDGWVLYQTTISDTGIGMSEEFLPHLFEEFSREQNTTDAKVEGTGLGMPIVKRLVEMLDGTIEVKSRKGEGSEFIVTIPHRIADKANLVNHAGVEIDPKLFEGKRILLAEDNDLNAEIAAEILGEAGFITDRAEDGRICVDMLEKAEAGHYDLILMDIQMPNMNGFEATKAIRQLEDHDKANIKILAMTANAFEEDRREALKAGMNGHLAKPINVSELMKTLAGLIG